MQEDGVTAGREGWRGWRLGSKPSRSLSFKHAGKVKKLMLLGAVFKSCWWFCIRQNGALALRIVHVPADVGDS